MAINPGGLGAAAFRTGLPAPGLPAYLIGEIPRPLDDAAQSARQPADAGRGQRVAALAAAYHVGLTALPGTTGQPGTVAFGWIRCAAGGPVRGGAAGAAPGGSELDPGRVLLSLPAGARASRLAEPGLAALAGQLPWWRAVAVISDGLLTAGGPDQPGVP